MPSPFPGMDPYLEGCGLWDGFHRLLTGQLSIELADAVPSRYVVRTGERSYLVLVDSDGKTSYPLPPNVNATRPGRRSLDVAGDKPHILRAFVEEEHRETFVEIYEVDPAMRLVTAIEVLSPSNKRPDTPGWDLYQRKRQSLLLGEANLVEIDLLRGGQRMPMLDPWPDCPYVLLSARAGSAQLCRVWEAHFQRPLPAISVPLRKPDPDLSLSLQPLIDTIYRRFRYEQSIDYSKELTPALGPEEAAWWRQRQPVRS